MIDEKIREAWKTWKGSANIEQLLRAACVLVDAYVDAAAHARELRHILECHESGICEHCEWTPDDWEKAVREELEK